MVVTGSAGSRKGSLIQGSGGSRDGWSWYTSARSGPMPEQRGVHGPAGAHPHGVARIVSANSEAARLAGPHRSIWARSSRTTRPYPPRNSRTPSSGARATAGGRCAIQGRAGVRDGLQARRGRGGAAAGSVIERKPAAAVAKSATAAANRADAAAWRKDPAWTRLNGIPALPRFAPDRWHRAGRSRMQSNTKRSRRKACASRDFQPT